MPGSAPLRRLGGTTGRRLRPATAVAVALFVVAVVLALGLSGTGEGARLGASVTRAADPHVEIPDSAVYTSLALQDGPAVLASPLPDPASSTAAPVPGRVEAAAPAVPVPAAAPAAAPAAGPAAAAPADVATAQMLTYLNSSRRAAGLPPLALDATLNSHAAAQTRWMVQNAALCHSTVCNPGAVPRGRFQLWGENVGWVASPDVPALHRAFMDSPTHRENILRREFTYVGLSWSQGRLAGKPGTYWFMTEQFGSARRGG